MDVTWVDRLLKVTKDDWIGHGDMVNSVVRSSVMGSIFSQHASDSMRRNVICAFIVATLGNLIEGDYPPPITVEAIQAVKD